MNAREWSLRIAELLRRERAALADVLLALAEFDRRGLHRELGFASLFDYLHRELGLSRGAAHYRQVATRLVEAEENRHEVLPRFFRRSRQEARQVAVEIRPAEVVPRRTVVTLGPVPAAGGTGNRGSSTVELELARPSAVPRTVVEPLTAKESRIHITVSPGFVALLAKARAGQSHVHPRATDEQVLTAALDLLLAAQAKRKTSVPAKVKREVRKRDEGRCQWPLASGGICGSVVRTEVDHVVPRGQGGPSTVENCRILCKVHNLEAARDVYGTAFIDLFAHRTPRVSEPVTSWPPIPPFSREAFHPLRRTGERHDDPDQELPPPYTSLAASEPMTSAPAAIASHG
jgi:5-methylcytosine-specific restriction endonuclease McrA